MIDCWHGFKLFVFILGVVTVSYPIVIALTLNMHDYNFMGSPTPITLIVAYGYIVVLGSIIIAVFIFIIICVIAWTCGAFINVRKPVVISTKSEPEKEHPK